MEQHKEKFTNCPNTGPNEPFYNPDSPKKIIVEPKTKPHVNPEKGKESIPEPPPNK